MRGRPKTRGPEWLQHVPEQYRQQVFSQVLHTGRPASSSADAAIDMLLPVLTLPPAAPLPSASVSRFQIRNAATDMLVNSVSASDAGTVEDAALASLGNPPATDGTANAGTIEHMETNMVQALKSGRTATPKSKAACKRPAAADGCKNPAVCKKPVVCKKPSAAAAVCKKPATSAKFVVKVCMSGLFAKLRQEKHLKRKNFTSKAYHHSYKSMLDAGSSEAEAKRFAREQSAKASALYSQL